MEVERDTPICSIQKLKNRLGLTTENCGTLQNVVCSSPGSGCGFVVVAVLIPRLLFRSVFLSIGLQRVDGQVAVDCVDTASGALQRPPLAKAGHPPLFGHPRCQIIHTVYAFRTTFVSQTDIFAFFGFRSLFSLPKSLFVPLYSELHHCNKHTHTRKHTGFHPKILSTGPSAVSRAFRRRGKRGPRSRPTLPG